MQSRRWDEEADAATIVCAQLGGVSHRVDPGGGSEQVHDFDVHLPDGTVVAVEVTRHNVPANHARSSELAKRDWRFPQLRKVWVVHMIGTYKVGEVHRQIGGLLLSLETAGITYLRLDEDLFEPEPHEDWMNDDEYKTRDLLDRTRTRAVAERLRDLGARVVYSETDGGPDGGKVCISETGQGGSTSPSVIVEMIEHLASLPDNEKKLRGASDRAERHLFVWVESSQHAAVAAFAALQVAGMPDRAPTLPNCVDAVWAVTAFDPAHILLYDRVHGWCDRGIWRRPVS